MTDRSDHWQTVYGTKSPTEVSWFEEEPRVSLDLIARVAGPGASIIDVGGGASRLADRLLDRGFSDLTVLDIAEGALAASRARLGDRAAAVSWVVADITRWQPPRGYDVWHDRAVFHFLVEPGERLAYLESLRTGLKDGGHAIIGTFAPDGPEKCSGLPVQRYDARTLGAELGQGFSLVESLRHGHGTPWGSVQNFQFAVFRKEHGSQ